MPDNEGNPTRRKVLRNTAATGLLGTVGAGSASATTVDDSDVDVEVLTGSAKNRAIADALGDAAVSQIKTAYVDDGWRMRRADAIAYRTERDGDTHESVFLPFDTPPRPDAEPDATGDIMWSNNPDREPVGHFYPDGPTIDPDGSETQTVHITTVSDGDLVTESSTLTSDEVTTQAAACWCTGSIDLQCIAKTALAVGAGAESCKACYVDATRISCLACASVLLLAGWSLTDCCTDCWKCCDYNLGINCSTYC